MQRTKWEQGIASEELKELHVAGIFEVIKRRVERRLRNITQLYCNMLDLDAGIW